MDLQTLERLTVVKLREEASKIPELIGVRAMSKEELHKAREARDDYKARFHALDKDMDGTMNVLTKSIAEADGLREICKTLQAEADAKAKTEAAVEQSIYDCDEDG
jgi:uncharacterized coiled-coil DUF342 family protein